MGRIVLLFVIIVALVGGLFLLSRIDTTRPLTRVEKTVSVDALAR
jgi:hypothetical protein